MKDELDADRLESFIAYAKEKGLGNKQLARAQALACDKAFEKLYHEGYMNDDEYGMFTDMLKLCYMMKEDGKYKYETIAKGAMLSIKSRKRASCRRSTGSMPM